MQASMPPFQADSTVLLLVDIQPDFMPGGPLAVPGGDEIVLPVAGLLERNLFRHVVATQDWHPRGHISFASSHPNRAPFDVIDLYGHEQVLWPDHCVQGTPGADLHPSLDWRGVTAVVRKGMESDTDSYSGFRNNWNPRGQRPSTGLAGYLRDRGIDRIFVCGLARDYCVKWSAEDAAAAGFDTTVLWDLTRSVVPDSDEGVRQGLADAGVRIVESAAIVG